MDRQNVRCIYGKKGELTQAVSQGNSETRCQVEEPGPGDDRYAVAFMRSAHGRPLGTAGQGMLGTEWEWGLAYMRRRDLG